MKADKIKVSELKNYLGTNLNLDYKGLVFPFTQLDAEEGLIIGQSPLNIDDGNYPHNILAIKPIVRPFESMTDEEAIHIAKIVGDIHNDSMDDKFKVSIKGYIVVDTPWFGRIQLFYKGRNIHFRVYSTEWNNLELKEALNVQKALEYLYSKGFDVFNWISRGLAIEKKND